MPANVGEMFYTGAVPWHGLGVPLARPADLDEALKVGGLNWQVDEVDLLTVDDPPSPVPRRKALVRSDRAHGDAGRVLGVAHREFAPVQNRDAGMLFDAIFGRGKRVYCTGGYLGNGEVVWLLAKIDKTIRIQGDDVIEPYALMANSHDGSMALNIRLTTVRVVCQNTLSLAMKERIGIGFRRAHQGSFAQHAAAAQEFFATTMRELDTVSNSFTILSKLSCSDTKFEEIVAALLPEPKKPRKADGNPGLLKAWTTRLAAVKAARTKISELRVNGKGMDLDGSRGTFWGALNAVLEYVDHHRRVEQDRIAYALLGDGMDLKMRAFSKIQEMAAAA
jgi:phage/plasmid-like protein (TIGR03299 family)